MSLTVYTLEFEDRHRAEGAAPPPEALNGRYCVGYVAYDCDKGAVVSSSLTEGEMGILREEWANASRLASAQNYSGPEAAMLALGWQFERYNTLEGVQGAGWCTPDDVGYLMDKLGLDAPAAE